MGLIMVPDPDYKGKDGASTPHIPRAWAMRKLFKQGMSVGDIGRKYGTTYATAYKMIKPPKLRATSAGSTAAKPLTKERLASLTKAQLMKIVYAKAKTPEELKRVERAADELDSRYPGWND